MKYASLLLTCLIFAGCASAPTPKTTYLLRSDVIFESRELQHGAVPVAIGRIELANYLAQPGIVTADADGAIHVSNYNLWAEPLQKSAPCQDPNAAGIVGELQLVGVLGVGREPPDSSRRVSLVQRQMCVHRSP